MGKPSKLTDERRDALAALIEAGNRLEPACEAAGITYRTHRNWYARGEEEADRLDLKPTAKPRSSESSYLQYFQAIKKAQAQAEIVHIDTIQKTAQGGTEIEHQTIEKFAKSGELIERKEISTLAPPNWTAAAWWLERRLPLEYGKRDTLKVEMEVQAQLEQLFSELRGALSPSALAEIEAFVAERAREESGGQRVLS